jgi:hypothetical protein
MPLPNPNCETHVPPIRSERIFAAERAGVRNRLIGNGMTPETADRWLNAWVFEATGRGLPRNGRYWQAAWDWIAAESAARRPGC